MADERPAPCEMISNGARARSKKPCKSVLARSTYGGKGSMEPAGGRQTPTSTLSWPSVTPRGHGAWVAAASSEELSRTPRGAML